MEHQVWRDVSIPNASLWVCFSLSRICLFFGDLEDVACFHQQAQSPDMVCAEPLLDELTGECVILKMSYFSPKLPYTAGSYQTLHISYRFPKLLCTVGKYQTL